MLGVVNLDKPVGPTSHDMVALMRRLTGTRRIGHAGTLDPLASGVLPILVGAATRFSEELTAGRKRYEAVIRLGWRSATDDAEGPIEPGSAPPGAEVAVAALSDFIGTFAQRPPAFSARKIGGRTAHRAARAGTPVDLPARTVTVESLDLLAVEGGPEWLDLRVDLRCGPGTYVRSIARDLGDALGCGGYLAALRRTEAAGLRADDGLRPERLEELAAAGRLASALIPIGELLSLPRLEIGEAAGDRFRHGAVVRIDGVTSVVGRHAVFVARQLVGVGTLEAGLLQPDKVIGEVTP
ncbi:MAG TPA: tRNA pseudouridine(55) synthase TruB [Candidatus Limnocylindria bacterium]|nr:tRNA pseudouridine(55) synthase TruB [Candidatus Limnocylindria bacterium]